MNGRYNIKTETATNILTEEDLRMNNIDLRAQMKKEGVRQWQVAEALNFDESVFSRKMRHELSLEEKQRIFEAIEKLSKEEK